MNAMSNGGFRVLDEGQGNRLLATAAGTVTFQIFATGGVVQVFNQSTVPPTKVYEGAGPVTLQPVDATKPIRLQEKGWYRGNIRFTNLGNTLRVTNFVNYDDYIRGVVPMEMLQNWHLEAYKAQAYAARSYAYTSYRGGASDYDVQDDQSDQCYGGVQLADSVGGRPIEGDVQNAAVTATAGKVIAYAGAAVRAYFSSSSGGYTLPFGCWGATKTTCADSPPYLVAVADPADPLVSVPTPNKQAGWTATYTSAQIRNTLLNWRGVDIGTLTSVDLSNQAPRGLGHVVSIRFTGTAGSIEVPADGFLRGQLGLKSTMVRLSPF
jgi:stage II sporulation protein D